MSLLSIDTHHYDNSAEMIVDDMEKYQDLNWAVYGSYMHGKVKPGLSDIDIFLLHHTNSFVFPIDISKNIGKVKSRISNLGIPLQITTHTNGTLSNPVSHPGSWYMKEVRRGAEGGICSQYFLENIEPKIQEEKNAEKEISMLNYFARKIGNLGENFPKMKHVITKNKNEISSDDIKELQSFWDSFKKVLSFSTVALRLTTQKSYFSEPNSTILEQYQSKFGNIDDISELTYIYQKVENLEDWYNFLKHENGFMRLEDIYTRVITPMIDNFYKNNS